MRILLHIGPDCASATVLQAALARRRDALRAQGLLFARSPGARNHTRLYMAVTDPGNIDPLRLARGYLMPAAQAALRQAVTADLAQEVATHRPEVLILSAAQLLPGLLHEAELRRLHALLAPLSEQITVIAHVEAQPRMMLRAYAAQLLEGRRSTLELEQALPTQENWTTACLSALPPANPFSGQFPKVQAPLFWLDYAAVVARWEAVFGAGTMRLCPHDPQQIHGPGLRAVLSRDFGLPPLPEPEPEAPAPPPLSAATLTRARRMNALLGRYLQQERRLIDRRLRLRLLSEISVPGPAPDPGELVPLCARFAQGNAALSARWPELAPVLTPPADSSGGRPWQEADPGFGFRPSPYLLALRWHIDHGDPEGKTAEAEAFLSGADSLPASANPEKDGLSLAARALLPPAALARYHQLRQGPFAPHDRLGKVPEEAEAPPYRPAPARSLSPGCTGRVVIACMKNEAPYILEWIAHHRAIGFDAFLIYSNDCTDGTAQILERLQQMGVIAHRNNDGWQGKSPQQWALDRALQEPLIRDAEWIAHFDVDEFVNIRCGNGTLDDLLARVPGATNIAMTWRLFGHDGVTRLEDRPVLDQFTRCAPKYCPKPHTSWGFKTLYRNIGAYRKLSCHRPNKLDEGRAAQVAWVNGSGQPMPEALRSGWRNSRASIGYDLLQLNHYALRSAESFLVKRQRGRALHVDRSIGYAYWLRMDWNDHRDLTIRRNLPRMQAELSRLKADPALAALHEAGFAWHRAKVAALLELPEFRKLYTEVLQLKLSATERAAYALTLDQDGPAAQAPP
ncbi:glycosyltransferase family 2 protein [Pseudooceanicola sp. CBS1P-1]|uniref:Glycosyltransferase family 2 protein n=1 Tax=Pseudooceanicola albus TaxID=2692189 RepID=A0A6L7G007_9RHOB|nr:MULTISPECIES: glycosyltransferase family 2 protein [Pseudooceanicola]MBT9382481.1 glycosyltransferase family 2 protein [Pseudooceanicola endophyticus]MXN17022.1 glycosyltransferase family 2 protein [Pseudooceanicola albus]